jgi:hypothetical protein
MDARTIVIREVASISTAPVVRSGQSASLANSYPDDMERVLASTETTPTGDGEREKAFKRAGLR